MPSKSVACRIGRRGVSSLEFGLVVGPLLLLMFSGMELALYSATVTSFRAWLDETARAATLTGNANLIANATPCTNITAARLLPSTSPTHLIDRSRLTLTVNSCVTTPPVTTVTMTARYQHSFRFSLLSAYSGTIVETATASFN